MYTVVGFKDVDFKDKSSGASVQGVTVYVTFEEENDTKLKGLMCDKIFIPLSKFESVCENVKVGSILDISYNRFGKVGNVTLL